MNKDPKADLIPLLVVLVCEVILFIPAARLLDSLFPGPHAGFTLMAIWLYLVVPGAVVLATAALYFYPRAVRRGPTQAARFLLAAWVINVLGLAAAMVRYRTTV